mgnify:CR=1 FL=1
MKDLKIETESPLSIAEQIEVLELAKSMLLELYVGSSCKGLCYVIAIVIYYKHNHLYNLISNYGVHKVIPLFDFPHAVLSGTVDHDAVTHGFWWDREISKGGITNRLAFLDWLIERLKKVERENTKRTTTE